MFSGEPSNQPDLARENPSADEVKIRLGRSAFFGCVLLVLIAALLLGIAAVRHEPLTRIPSSSIERKIRFVYSQFSLTTVGVSHKENSCYSDGFAYCPAISCSKFGRCFSRYLFWVQDGWNVGFVPQSRRPCWESLGNGHRQNHHIRCFCRELICYYKC